MDIICIADTHNQHETLNLPFADILVHAGDFTDGGTKKQSLDFLEWFSAQPHKHKILVAGNHDFYFEKQDPEELKSSIPENIHYLEDSGVIIEGIKFWGSPATPGEGLWAFRRERGREIAKHWTKIPPDVDVLITHTPPYGILDELNNKESIGCEELLKKLKEVKPQLHIFGHIHEAPGAVKTAATHFINASVAKAETGSRFSVYTYKWEKG